MFRFKHLVILPALLIAAIAVGAYFGHGVVARGELPEASKQFRFDPSGGDLSPYLVGTWEAFSQGLGGGSEVSDTIIELVNPTSKTLLVMVAFFDDDERPLCRVEVTMTQNDFERFSAGFFIIGKVEPPAFRGVVKVVSFSEDGEEIQPGVVGYQKVGIFNTIEIPDHDVFSVTSASQAPLHPIPVDVLLEDHDDDKQPDELAKILAMELCSFAG